MRLEELLRPLLQCAQVLRDARILPSHDLSNKSKECHMFETARLGTAGDCSTWRKKFKLFRHCERNQTIHMINGASKRIGE